VATWQASDIGEIYGDIVEIHGDIGEIYGDIGEIYLASDAEVATWQASALVGAKLEPRRVRAVRAHASALTNSGEIETSSGGTEGSK